MNIKTEKREAAAFLNKKGRRVNLVFYGLILIFVTVAPVFLYSYVAYLLSVLVTNVFSEMTFSPTIATLISYSGVFLGALVAAIFIVFVTLPLFHSFFGYSYRMYREGSAGKNRFLRSGEQGYFGLLCAGMISVGVLVISLVPIAVFSVIGNSLAVSVNTMVASIAKGLFLLIMVLGVALGFCVFLLFRPIFLFGYFSARGDNVRLSLKKSRLIMKRKGAKQLYFVYMKSFLPSLCLAVPTFLVLFFVDTLPKMIIVYYRLADELVYGDT